MGAQLNPSSAFPGTAREAMTFYRSVLGGTLDIMTFGQYGAEARAPTASCTRTSRPPTAWP